MRTGKVRSAEVIISRGLPGMTSSLFVLADFVTPVIPCCPAPWAYRAAKLSSGHVRTRSPLLRCQRDQTRLLGPAASADSEFPTELERGADRSPAGGSLRHQDERAQSGRVALGPRALLGQRPQGRLRKHQRQGGGDREEASLPRGVPAAPLPCPGRQLL